MKTAKRQSRWFDTCALLTWWRRHQSHTRGMSIIIISTQLPIYLVRKMDCSQAPPHSISFQIWDCKVVHKSLCSFLDSRGKWAQWIADDKVNVACWSESNKRRNSFLSLLADCFKCREFRQQEAQLIHLNLGWDAAVFCLDLQHNRSNLLGR